MCWSARAKSFISGGTRAEPPYDHSGETIRASDELNRLLKQQEKFASNFPDFLAKPELVAGLVRSRRSFIGNFSMWTIKAW